MDVKQQFIKMKQENNQAEMPAKISSALTIYRATNNITGPFDESVLLNLQNANFLKRKRITNEERDAFVLKAGILLGQCVVEALNGSWSMTSQDIYDAKVVIDLPEHTVYYDPFEDARKFFADRKRFLLTTAFKNLVKQVNEKQ